MQMREKNEIMENFILRLGEHHTVFAFFKVIGKYILGSYIGHMLIEAWVHGPKTIGQMFDGKQMK